MHVIMPSDGHHVTMPSHGHHVTFSTAAVECSVLDCLLDCRVVSLSAECCYWVLSGVTECRVLLLHAQAVLLSAEVLLLHAIPACCQCVLFLHAVTDG